MGETAMSKKLTSDYQLCPLFDAARIVALGAAQGRAEVSLGAVQCDGPRCAWWDADKERCAVLSIARKK